MRWYLLILGLSLLAALPAGAQDIWVTIVEPKDGDLVIGELDVVVEVVSRADIAEIEFQLDGRPIGTFSMEPFRLHVDLGEKNLPHRFSVVAVDVEGNRATHSVNTKPFPIAGDYEVELQQLYVSVTRGGERVLDVEQDHFTVLDEGVPQELVTFARGDIPFTAVLLIDASASMFGEKIESAVAGAASFIYGMKELDQAQVMVFSDQLLSTTPITGAREVLTAGLSSTEARGGTALQDHLFVALELIAQRQGRRVMIVLSDGVDTHSVVNMPQVFEVARRSNALIYWIRISSSDDTRLADSEVNMTSAWKDAAQYRQQIDLLNQVVGESGGRVLRVGAPDEIRPVFIDILRELREQYVLGYYPNDRRNDGRWHKVRVEVAGEDVEVRAPRGYVDH
ncbi:MAG: VWA domain-containing protein [Thermoanaerobaculales bacterium]|nr:VWA domain-containing protein [Thermoanaerobaculales bacterium]